MNFKQEEQNRCLLVTRPRNSLFRRRRTLLEKWKIKKRRFCKPQKPKVDITKGAFSQNK